MFVLGLIKASESKLEEILTSYGVERPSNMDADKSDHKIYCCSNSTRSEALKLSIFDVFAWTAIVIYSIIGTVTVKSHSEDYLRNETRTESANATLEFYFSLNEPERDFFLASILIWGGWLMALGGTLFYAAYSLRPGLLKVWFGLTLIEVSVEVFCTVMMVVYLRFPISTTVVCLIVLLYKWYELWIVYRLIGEILQLFRGSSSKSKSRDPEATPALVVDSPTPTPADPDAVLAFENPNSKSSTPTKSIQEIPTASEENPSIEQKESEEKDKS